MAKTTFSTEAQPITDIKIGGLYVSKNGAVFMAISTVNNSKFDGVFLGYSNGLDPIAVTIGSFWPIDVIDVEVYHGIVTISN